MLSLSLRFGCFGLICVYGCCFSGLVCYCRLVTGVVFMFVYVGLVCAGLL